MKKFVWAAIATLCLSLGLAPSALAKPYVEPVVPITGNTVTYTVTSDKSFDAKATYTIYYGDGPQSSVNTIRPYPSWTRTVYTKGSYSASSASLHVVDQGNIKGYGVPKYTCKITVNGAVTSSNTGVGSVSC